MRAAKTLLIGTSVLILLSSCAASTPPLPPITSWGVFRNSELGFEIQYPHNTAIEIERYEEELDRTDFIQQKGIGEGTTFRLDVMDIGDMTLSAWLHDNDRMSQTAYEGEPSKEIIETKNMEFSGKPAIQRIELWDAAGFTTVVTYFKNGDQLYDFAVLPSSDIYNEQEKVIYDTMLMSLKLW